MVMSPHHRQALFPKTNPTLETDAALVALTIALRQCIADLRDLHASIMAAVEDVECEIVR